MVLRPFFFLLRFWLCFETLKREKTQNPETPEVKALGMAEPRGPHQEPLSRAVSAAPGEQISGRDTAPPAARPFGASGPAKGLSLQMLPGGRPGTLSSILNLQMCAPEGRLFRPLVLLLRRFEDNVCANPTPNLHT